MTRSAKRHRPAVMAVPNATDKLTPFDPTEVPQREQKLPSVMTRIAKDREIDGILERRDALPPPPGYRYTMDGRLVPLAESELPIDDPEAQAIFCEVLEVTGSLRAAADALGIRSLGKVKAYMSRDIDFQEQCEAAADRHRQSLYAHAIQRATTGYQKPIIGGKDKDQIVGYETVVSDSLLKLLLQRHFPEFRPKPPETNVTVNANPAHSLPNPRQMTREQRDALRLLLGESAPPEPDPNAIEVIDTTEEPNEN